MFKLFKKVTTQWFWGAYTHTTYYRNGKEQTTNVVVQALNTR